MIPNELASALVGIGCATGAMLIIYALTTPSRSQVIGVDSHSVAGRTSGTELSRRIGDSGLTGNGSTGIGGSGSLGGAHGGGERVTIVDRMHTLVSNPGGGLVHAAMMFAAFVVGFTATGWVAGGFVAAVVTYTLPLTRRTRATNRHKAQQLRALASWTETIRDLLRAANGVESALIASVPLANTAIAAEVEDLAASVMRGNMRDGLQHFGDTLADPISDQVVWALAIAAENPSGAITDVLSQAAANARARLSTRERIDASRTKTFTTVNAMMTMTVLLAVTLLGTQPLYQQWYASLTGQTILIGATTIQTIAYITMLRLTRHSPGIRLPISFTTPTPAASGLGPIPSHD